MILLKYLVIMEIFQSNPLKYSYLYFGILFALILESYNLLKLGNNIREGNYLMKTCDLLKYMGMRFFLLLFIAFALTTGCTNKSKPTFTTEYQAVFLDNGQAFFGKLEKADSPYPLLKDVFYIQQQVNKDTKEVKSILIKRGNEWHGPDRMYINSKHIVLIEPVSPDSKVAQLIKDAKAKKTDTKQ